MLFLLLSLPFVVIKQLLVVVPHKQQVRLHEACTIRISSMVDQDRAAVLTAGARLQHRLLADARAPLYADKVQRYKP
jgi:hypothetical protein